MPGGLLSVISGILAGGILGFGAAVWIVLDTFARSYSDVRWCSSVALQDLLIHWHISCLPQRSCLLIGVDFLKRMLRTIQGDAAKQEATSSRERPYYTGDMDDNQFQ